MPSVTRQRIKAIESYRRSISQPPRQQLQGLGIFEDLLGDPVLKKVLDWLSGKTGQYKITATEFAENIVKVFYGLEGDCSLPPTGIPIIPRANPPKFCAGSIAGMIERCKLYEAANTLATVKAQLEQRIAGTDEVAPYVKRWYNEYGKNDILNLGSKITAAKATCGIVSDLPQITPTPIPPGPGNSCPYGYAYNAATNLCAQIPGSSTGTPLAGGNTTLYVLLAVGLAAIFLMKR